MSVAKSEISVCIILLLLSCEMRSGESRFGESRSGERRSSGDMLKSLADSV